MDDHSASVVEGGTNDSEALLRVEKDELIDIRVKSPERYSWSCLWAEIK